MNICRLWRDSRGTAALEFALVAPCFLMLVCGTVELSHWAWGAAATRDMAARAARCIMVNRDLCGTEAAVGDMLHKTAPVIAAASDIRFEQRRCGLTVIVDGGFPAVVTPGLGPTTAVLCAG
jgi:hypothetical protein